MNTKFKQTELGEIPEEWITTRIDGCIDIIDGDRGVNYPNKNDFSDNDFCLFLNTGNVPGNTFDFSKCQFISKEKDEVLGKGKLKKGDIILTTRGTVGNVAYFNNEIPFENVRINSGMVILRQKDMVDMDFIYQQLTSDFVKIQIKELSSGSAQPQLPIKDLRFLKLIVPPLPEQQQITSILSSLDDKIELNRKMNKTLEDMAKALFKHWFVDFEFPFDFAQGKPNEEGKPLPAEALAKAGYKSSGGEMVESELGFIPDGWKVGVYGDIVNLKMGLSPKSEYYNSNNDGFPLLNGAADYEGDLFKPTKYSTVAPRTCNKGDIVFCIRGTIGKIAIADTEYCLGRGVAAI